MVTESTVWPFWAVRFSRIGASIGGVFLSSAAAAPRFAPSRGNELTKSPRTATTVNVFAVAEATPDACFSCTKMGSVLPSHAHCFTLALHLAYESACKARFGPHPHAKGITPRLEGYDAYWVSPGHIASISRGTGLPSRATAPLTCILDPLLFDFGDL